MTVYSIGSNGNATPSATITGANTGLVGPEGIAFDSGGNIYLADTGANQIDVFPAGSTGNVAPSATISGASTGLAAPVGIALDSARNIYVANDAGGFSNLGSVTVFSAGSSGNVAPTATISGANTGLKLAQGIALDSARNIYVANYAGGPSDLASVTVYAAGSSGNAAPTATISGASTGLSFPFGIVLDSSQNIYVTNKVPTVTVYPAGSNGNVAPSAAISGPASGLTVPQGIALDNANNIYVANCNTCFGSFLDSMTVYPALTGNKVTPSAVINSAFALTSNGMAEPDGIALDSGANIYVTGFAAPIEVYTAGSGATGETPPTSFGNEPYKAVAFDSAQNIYAVDTANSEVDVFDTSFNLVGILVGRDTLLSQPAGIAIDTNDNIYVTDDATDTVGDRVTVYPPRSSGDSPPSAVIVGSSTELAFPAGITVDAANIYVANKATDSVTVYPLASNGNVPPSANISGPNTLLNTPSAVELDSTGQIYVANEGGYEGNNVSVTVYAKGTTGNTAPVTTISGPVTQLARPGGIAIVP